MSYLRYYGRLARQASYSIAKGVALPIFRHEAMRSGAHEMAYPIATYAPWKSDAEFDRVYKAIRKSTFVDVWRCHELWTLLGELREIPGAILEVGVWRGGTGALMAARARELELVETVYLCDTWTGVVKTTDVDTYYRDEPDSRPSSSPPSNVGRATAPEPGDAEYSGGFFADSRPSRAREFFNDVEPPHERELFGDVAAPPRQGSRGQASAPPARDPRQEPPQGPTQQGPTQDETAREAASWPRREPGRSLGELFDVPPVEHAEPIVPAGWRPPPVPPSTPAPAPPETQPASSAYPPRSAYPMSPAHPASSAYPQPT